MASPPSVSVSVSVFVALSLSLCVCVSLSLSLRHSLTLSVPMWNPPAVSGGGIWL
jgi:hypothetical protein